MKTRKLILTIFSLTAILFCSFKFIDEKSINQSEVFISDRDSIKRELTLILKNEFSLWYPISIDTTYGGFFSDLDYMWQLKGKQNKFLVTQSRHIWSNANAATFYDDKQNYLNVASHGYLFLKNKMWDNKYGGFYDLLDRQGEVIQENGRIIKRAYGNSFAIYGLAAYYKVSNDTAALNLAVKAFNWLDEHS